MNEADLLELFEVMRERGGGDIEFLLNFADNHARGMGGKKKADDLQAGLRAESGEAVGRTGNQEGIGPRHISIFAEIWKKCQALSPNERLEWATHLMTGHQRGNAKAFCLLTEPGAHGILEIPRTNMRPIQTLCTLLVATAVGGAAFAQTGPGAAPQNQKQAAADTAAPASSRAGVRDDSKRAEAYYDYTMGHIMEEQYQSTSQEDYATRAIDYYKKAYVLDPESPVIGERLAEMYWESQRVHDAELEALGSLKANPNDVQTRRLLGHIYLRSLGDPNAASQQSGTVAKAIEQFQEVVRLDPTDTESALWLARLYRLQNDPDKAEAVLRGILKGEPDNDPALEQLTQLLLDEGKSKQAVGLLEGITAKSPSATLLDLLGDAYAQTKDFAKAETAYRKSVELDPSEPSHYRGLGQALLSEGKYPEALTVYQNLIDMMPDDPDNN